MLPPRASFALAAILLQTFVLQGNESHIESLGLDPIVSEVPIIGVVGDSLSDEYITYPYGFLERNWTMLLQNTGYANLGDFQSLRMYPRLYGYGFNWARAGATSSDVIAEGQALGLAAQLFQEKVEVAVVMAGANDIREIYTSAYDGTLSDAQRERFLNDLRSNFDTIVLTLALADPKLLIVCTIPDLGDTSRYRFERYPDAEKRATVTKLIEDANREVVEAATRHDAVVLDTFAWFKDMTTQPEFRFLGYRIQTETAGVEPFHLLSIDGFHPGTLAQTYLGNQILDLIESERVRRINLQIETLLATHPGQDIPLLTPRHRGIPNHVIFPLLGIAPNADLFFPNSNFTDPSRNVIRSEWFGILAIDRYPWINHQEHGWLYCDGYGGSVWVRLWDSHLGWLHTKPEAYPIVIQLSTGHALRYELGSREPRRFFDLETQSWIEVPYGAPILPEE